MTFEKEIKEKEENCVVCSGKYSALVLSTGCYDVDVCKKHLLEITKILQDKLKREKKELKL